MTMFDHESMPNMKPVNECIKLHKVMHLMTYHSCPSDGQLGGCIQ